MRTVNTLHDPTASAQIRSRRFLCSTLISNVLGQAGAKILFLIVVVLNTLWAQSLPQPADHVVLQINKTGGIGGVDQEYRLFRNGLMVFPGGNTVNLDPREVDRLLALAKQLTTPSKRKKRGHAQMSDYPLIYRVWINDEGKQRAVRFPAETSDPAANRFIGTIKLHERRVGKTKAKQP